MTALLQMDGLSIRSSTKKLSRWPRAPEEDMGTDEIPCKGEAIRASLTSLVFQLRFHEIIPCRIYLEVGAEVSYVSSV